MSGAPVVAVGAIVRRGDEVLLVQRGTPPNENQWAIPGGRVHLGETLQLAAEREILEETGIRIKAGAVLYTFEHIERDSSGAVRFHYVVLDLAGEYLSGEPRAGDDAREARWIPLARLAQWPVNATTMRALRQLFPELME
ncbi:MAG TPA: NUDIX hydrolase [Gammaproteobacteria bacterium]